MSVYPLWEGLILILLESFNPGVLEPNIFISGNFFPKVMSFWAAGFLYRWEISFKRLYSRSLRTSNHQGLKGLSNFQKTLLQLREGQMSPVLSVFNSTVSYHSILT